MKNDFKTQRKYVTQNIINPTNPYALYNPYDKDKAPDNAEVHTEKPYNSPKIYQQLQNSKVAIPFGFIFSPFF